MVVFLPKPIDNIIISYLNLHEYYTEELINKTRLIRIHSNVWSDCGYDKNYVIIRGKSLWKIGSSFFHYLKEDKIKKLNKRVNNRNKILGIAETNRYGTNKKLIFATNCCYINY